MAQGERLSEHEYAEALAGTADILQEADAVLGGTCPLKPDTVWCHQPVERYVLAPLDQHVPIDRDALLRIVSHYLDQPRLRTAHVDRLLFDALLFVEIDGVLQCLPDGAINRAESRLHYPLFTLWHRNAAFWLVPAMRRSAVTIKYTMLPALAGLASLSGHGRLALALLAAFVVQVLIYAAPLMLPSEQRRKVAAQTRLVKLIEAYRMLEDENIDAAQLRATLNALTRMDVKVSPATRERLEQLAHISPPRWRVQELPSVAGAASNVGHAN